MRHLRYIVILGCLVASLMACQHKDVRLQAEAVEDRSIVPVLNTSEVTTLISDSGITRYRVTTQTWQIYDKADPPYWEFPDGVSLERFDEDMKVESTLRADYAHYNEREQIWHLIGNVHSVNAVGEEFETPELFWSQENKRVYSDSAISITKKTSIIKGIGFESNQEMTKYVIHHPTGVFPLDEE